MKCAAIVAIVSSVLLAPGCAEPAATNLNFSVREVPGASPGAAWTAAVDADGEPRDGAQVADLTGLLDHLEQAGWPPGVRRYSANVPMTLPVPDLIGLDQQARSPSGSARSRKSFHSGSTAMSAAATGWPKKAAVPQDPTSGPAVRPSIASM